MASLELEAVQKQHEELLKQSSTPGDISIEKILDFLTLLSQTGSVTEDVDQRSLLRAFINHWSNVVYDKTGSFPSFELLPFVGIRTNGRPDDLEGQQTAALQRKRPTRRQLLIGSAVLLVGGGIIGGGIILNEAARYTPPTPTPTASSGAIFVGDKLATGYDLGVNTSGQLTNWVTVKSGEICMAYPSGQSWGAVFITVGKATQPPRPGKDLSNYHQLSLELRGQAGGESVLIGIKDKNQPDHGSEARVPVSGLTTDWKSFVFPLSRFTGADLHKLYVVIEFVFAGTRETVCTRNIQYLL